MNREPILPPKRRFRAAPWAWLFLIVILIMVTGLVVETRLERMNLEIALKDQREQTLLEASLLASRIQAETNSTFDLVVGLARLIEINRGISNEQFQNICSRLVRERPGLRNIAAAPDLIIRHIYPIEGNEAALGLNYRLQADQRDAVFQAKETKEAILAGPLTLVQGGEAVVGRFPIYTHAKEGGESEFWGILSTPFDTEVLYRNAGLLDPALQIEVNLRGRDARGAKGELFYGSEFIDQAEPVSFPIQLLSGTWQMTAIPKGGWLTAPPNAIYIRSITTIVTLLILLLVVLYYLYMRHMQHSRQTEQEVALVKERFYANMSHELRTPLNGICGMSQLIKLTSEESEVIDNAKTILKSAETLTRLLDDVLILSQSEQLQLYNYRSIVLDDFIAELVPPLIHQAKSKGLAFNVESVPTEYAEIECDPAMLRQILWNLLSNAVKFTQSGEVSLVVTPSAPNHISFIIRDTGIGISPTQIDRIFEAFMQEDSSNTRKFGGAGLGLTIVQRFVQQLGGTIKVTSKKGHGSEFIFTLNTQNVKSS